MKRHLGFLIGAGALALLLSTPAHAQFGGGSTTTGVTVAGAGGFGGALSHATFPGMHSTPMPVFAAIEIQGIESDFVISTFVPFKDAYAEGEAVLAHPPKAIADVAEESSKTPRLKARLIFMQDANGRAIICEM